MAAERRGADGDFASTMEKRHYMSDTAGSAIWSETGGVRNFSGEEGGAALPPGDGDLRLAAKLDQLAYQYCRQGKGEEAESLYLRATGIRETVLGSHDPIVLDGLSRLARLYDRLGQYSRAETICERVVAGWEKSRLAAEKTMLAQSLNELATIYAAQRKYRQAEQTYRRSLAIVESTFGPDHCHAVDLLERVAELVISGDRDKLKKESSGPGPAVSISLVEALYELALFFHSQRAYRQAARFYRRAIDKVERDGGCEGGTLFDVAQFGMPANETWRQFLPEAAHSLQTMATGCRHQGKYTEAVSLTKRALVLKVLALGGEHPSVAASLEELGEIHWHFGRRAEAYADYRQALTIKENLFGPNHRDLAAVLSAASRICLAEGKLDESEKLMRRALQILEETGGMQSQAACHVLNNLADMCLRKGKYDLARRLSGNSLAIFESCARQSEPGGRHCPEPEGGSSSPVYMSPASGLSSPAAKIPSATVAALELDCHDIELLRLVAKGALGEEMSRRPSHSMAVVSSRVNNVMSKLSSSSNEEAQQFLRTHLAV